MLFVSIFAALVSAKLASGAQHSANDLVHGLDTKAEDLIEALHVPGLSFALVHDGKISARGYGYSQLPSTPATPDTLWFTGSTTKAFTAAIIGKIGQGHANITGLRWSTPLSEILGDDFVLQDEYASRHISFEDAMSHRSGLPRHDDAYGWGNSSTTDIVRTLRDLPFSAQPRTKWQYNNMMFAAVGEAIQRLTGSKLEEVFLRWFWEPLGMRSTTFSIDEADARQDDEGRSRLARGYYWTGKHYVPDRFIDIAPLAAAGATISSVNDYALWAKALLDADSGLNNETSPIDIQLWQSLTTPRSIIDDALYSKGAHSLTYALGWIIGIVGGKTVITHSGGLPGFGTQLYLIPEEGLAFVSVGNTVGTSAVAGALLFQEILHRLEIVDRQDKEDVAKDFQRMHTLTEPKPRSPFNHILRNYDWTALPLPGDISDYTGIYAHPAYGLFNITLAESRSHQQRFPSSQQSFRASPDPAFLLVTPSARTWSNVYALAHETHLSFGMTVYGEHGPAPAADAPCAGGKSKGRELDCKNEVAYQELGHAGALFERDFNGNVEKVGLEIAPELVGGGRHLREGMIWLRKVK